MQQRRRQPRAQVQIECVLRRRTGSPVICHTIDLGPGGMCVATDRPLGIDEVLHFDLAGAGGDARVLREQRPNVYALRFEAMHADAVLRLSALSAG